MSDYFPVGDNALLKWLKILYAAMLANFTRWNIPNPQPLLEAFLNAFESALIASQAPNRGKVDVLRKNEARTVVKKAFRVYIKAYLSNNPAVSDEDKTAAGLPVYSKTRSPIQAPDTAPRLSISTDTRRRLTIRYQDEKSGRRGKPHGVHGIEVRWAMLETAPADIDALVNSAFDTKPPLVIEFTESDRGKKVFMCGRWEIEREGEKGPFGAIEEAVVP